MIFNSYEFIFIFLPVMFVVYFYLNSRRLILGAKIWLVVGSLFFYSYWNVIYLPLILLSIFVNYGVGLSLVNHEKIKLSSKTILI
ncbi:MBOAT family protein, partial [Aliarcobacter cryaerophilus]|nr:MBOAT family protein [Aliarcobacter cryaerophilus]